MRNINWFGIIVDLCITVFAYMLIPISIKFKNGPCEIKKANKISLINSIVVCLLFAILRSIISPELPIKFGIPPAFLYFYINKKYLSYRKIVNEFQINKKAKSNNELNSKIINKKIKKSSPQRTEKIFSFNFKIKQKQLIAIIVYVLIIIIFSVGIYFLIHYINSLKDKIKSSENEYITLKRQYNSLDNEYMSKKNLYELSKEKIKFYDENIVFVLEGYGNYYYTYDQLQQVTNGKNFSYWAYNKDAAISEGYKSYTPTPSTADEIINGTYN